MNLKSLPLGDKFPDACNAVIEIPKGSHNKYEYDEELGVMKLDRVLHSAMFYPVDYGYFPQTHADDGDPLDVLLLTDSPVFPGCVVEVRPIGVLKMADEAGLDDKILCVAKGNPHFRDFHDLNDVDQHTLDELSNFFSTYKLLEKKEVKLEGWYDRAEAISLLNKARTSQ